MIDTNLTNRTDMDDKELDKLIMATMERRQTLETLNHTIVKDIRRRARRQWMRRWARLVAFSFGLPLMGLVFGWGIYVATTNSALGPLRLLLLIPLTGMFRLAWREMKNFSIAEV